MCQALQLPFYFQFLTSWHKMIAVFRGPRSTPVFAEGQAGRALGGGNADEETEAPSSEVTSPQPLSWITLAAVSTRDRGRQGQKRGDTEKATALV